MITCVVDKKTGYLLNFGRIKPNNIPYDKETQQIVKNVQDPSLKTYTNKNNRYFHRWNGVHFIVIDRESLED